MSLSRRWVFTINNYSDDEVEYVSKLQEDDNVRSVIAGLEVGEQGTPHIQGAVCWKSPKRFAAMRTLFPRAHLEVMVAKWDNNVAYCSKEANIIAEKKMQQGERTDIIDYVKAIREGGREVDLYKDENHMPVWAKYHHIYPRTRALMAKETANEFRKLEVVVLWGAPGSGKTSSIVEDIPDIYFAQPDLKWWPQYDGEDVILIDDFYGQCRPSWLLRVLDGYQLQIEYKGGHTYAKWTKVFITSNVHPSEWYSDIPDNVRGAIMRRITRVEEV